jgi:hypothetical protein
MGLDQAQLPNDVATLKALLIAADSRVSALDAEISNLKLTIAKLRRAEFSALSERGARLLDQLELQLGELVERVAHDKAAAGIAAAEMAAAPEKDKPARRPLPGHLVACANLARISPRRWSMRQPAGK